MNLINIQNVLRKFDLQLSLILTSTILITVTTRIFAEFCWYTASNHAKYGEYVRAEAYYQRAQIFLGSNSHFLFNNGAEALIAGKTQKAFELLKKAEQKTAHSKLYYYLGLAYNALGKIDDAERCYRIAMAMTPKYLRTKEKLVELYVAQGDLEKGRRLAKSALSFPYRVPTPVGDSIRANLQKFLDAGVLSETH